MQRDALFRGIPLFGTVMGEEWFAPWGYVAFRNIPVGIEGAASLWSKGVQLQARIDKAREEIKSGKCVTLKSSEDIDAYFDSL